MTQNIPHQTHTLFNLRTCQTRTQARADTDAMLRDIAFVLKMTDRVREDIEAEHESREPVLV